MSEIQFIGTAGPSMPLFAPYHAAGMKIYPAEPRPELPEFRFSPKIEDEYVDTDAVMTRIYNALRPHTVQGPMVPGTIQRKREPHKGKADPIWDVEFKAKISKPPEPKMVVPKGFTNPIEHLEDRATEINELARTQHLELSPIAAQLAANGFSVARVHGTEADDDQFNYVTDYVTTAYEPDPLAIAATSRLIEWERFKLGCGPVNRCRWVITDAGTLGIEYLGERWNEIDKVTKKPEYALAQKRKFKADWIEQHGSMPTVEEIRDEMEFIAHYKGRVALARMSEDEFHAFLLWRRGEDEDPMVTMRAAWLYEGTEREDMVGYAGPVGALFMDDDGTPYWSEEDDDQSE